jgi:hypothetical protein
MAKWMCVALALLLLPAANGSVSLAKPPDLPIDLGADFEEAEPASGITLGFDVISGKVSFAFAMPWNQLVGWLKEAIPVRPVQGPAPGRPNAACPPRDLDRDALTQEQARKMFDIAERCFKNGDLAKARVCYEETHLLAPESTMGRQAMERLVEIQNARTSADEGATEGQELPQEPSRRN